ncbi:alpha/beta hydrolase [Sphingomonas sp. Leaf357]|nr:alpha/beta hydrolase [Sphingomonas sp. Leaf357]
MCEWTATIVLTTKHAAALVIIVIFGGMAAAALTSPPGLLSFLDGIVGGGRGTHRTGTGVPFGTHGQALDVWQPSGGPRKNLPVVIFWYGGGWAHGSRGAYAFAGRALARRGFVAVIPDYRKVPQVRFPAFLQDGAEAVRWVRDHVADYGGDPNRIALAGHSAGAYTVAMLTLDQRWLRAENVDPHVIKAAVGLCGPYDFYPFTVQRAADAMRGAADPVMTQPIQFARADAAPMLLVSAGDDVQVRAHNAINLTARIKAMGGRVLHEDYPGLSHENIVMALSKPFRSKGPVLDHAVAFLNREMPPRAK